MAQRVQIAHIPALDGVRGAAIVGVVLFHAGHLRGGYLGVDLFLVLSGFLITSLLLAEASTRGGVDLGRFWSRRARRLLPALGGLLVFVALYCLLVAQPADLGQIRGDALATVGYVANWRAVVAGQDYWAIFRAPSPLNHTWSLAIEEQFYVVWPLVVVALIAWWKRRTPVAVFVTAMFGAGLSSLLMVVMYDPADPSRVYFGTDTRAAAVLLGAALSAALARWGPMRRPVRRMLLEVGGWVGAGALAAAWVTLDGRSDRVYRGGFLVAALAATAVIAAVAHPQPMALGRVLAWRPLQLLGVISYGIYLWHWPIDVVFTAGRTGVGGWTLVATQCLITIGIALASFVLIERPIRRGAGTPRQWSVALPGLAAGVVIAIVATTAGATGPPAARAVSERLDRAVQRARRVPAGTQRVMVIGDSVGWYLGDALASSEAAGRRVVANLSLLGCVFPSGLSAVTYTTTHDVRPNPPSCDRDWRGALDRFRPDIVIMFGWAEGNVRFEAQGHDEGPCDISYLQRTRTQLRAVAQLVQRAGGKFVITTYPVTVADGAIRSARYGVDCVNRVRREVAIATGSRLVDLARFVCPPGRACLTQVSGFALRPDGVHFSGPAAAGIARWLLLQL